MSRDTPNLPLNSLSDEELEIPVYEDGGALKSDVQGLLGTITRTGYSVFFQRIFEVHGRTNDSKVDNATLLVIKISPRVKDDGRQFKKFSVTLELEPAPGAPRNDKPPEFVSYEPAQEGVWFIKERTVNRSETGEVAGNIGGQVPGGVTLGFSAKKGVTEDSERRILHTVKAEPNYSPRADERPDKVTWKLSPADKSDGIGDYMAVAMLIERARGSRFVIKVESKASLGFISNAANAFPGRTETYLGPFGPAPKDGRVQEMPSGVSENALQMVSSENLLQTFAFIHIPEKVLPRSFYKNADTSAPLEPASTSAPSLSGISSTQILSTPSAQTNQRVENSLTSPVPNNSALMLEQAATARPSTVLAQHSDEHAPSETKRGHPNSLEDLPSTARTSMSHQNGSFRPNKVRFGTGVVAQQGRGKAFELHNSRAERHRKMAALYQRLAQLHREEAEEAEMWDERRYADEAEMDELY